VKPRWFFAIALTIATACRQGDAVTPADAPPSDPPPSDLPAAPTPSPSAATPETKAPEDAVPPEPAPEPVAPSPPPTRGFDDVKGMTTAELVKAWGEPDEKTGGRWRYRFPRGGGCTDEEIHYALTIRDGKVTKIDRTTKHTGKVCDHFE